MSLRKIILALLIANVGYFGYTQGWFKVLTGLDSDQREPERMNHQINSDTIQVTVMHEAQTSSKASVMPTNQMPPLPAVVEASAPTPAASCMHHEQWLIYMGPYPNQATSDKKKGELARLGISHVKEVSKPSLKLGLSLGQFETEASARNALQSLAGKGIKTATVVLWSTSTASDCP